jgi:hypothetical protein
VLEDLGRREVPVLWAAALHLLILLDPVEDLPQAAWVVGARNGSFLGPIPVRATIFYLRTVTLPDYRTAPLMSVLGSTRARVPPSGVPGTWSS